MKQKGDSEIREETIEDTVIVLPDKIATAIRKLWAQGQQRQALSMLYRASIEAVTTRLDIVAPPGTTESGYLRLARGLENDQDKIAFKSVINMWEYAAYADRLPDDQRFEAGLSMATAQFGWQ